MPCFYPLQASFSLRPDGKKNIKFCNRRAKLFHEGRPFCEAMKANSLALPCGKCMGCRVESTRQWAVRMIHESSLYEDNCFLTLTFDDENLAKMCPDGSISRRHMQDFMKSVKQKFGNGFFYENRDGDSVFYQREPVRQYYCGEYGEKLGRPHYHVCLFNADFPDKKFFTKRGKFPIYVSKILRDLWPYGNHGIGRLSFDSAAYCARYCTKKINGKMAESHYNGRLPEFGEPSRKPGLGHAWIERFGQSDVFPRDELIVNGARCKIPRYYMKYLEDHFPARFEEVKAARRERALLHSEEDAYARLKVKERCMAARMNKLVRTIETMEMV